MPTLLNKEKRGSVRPARAKPAHPQRLNRWNASMALDPDAIRRLATLSRLALSDDEVAGYSESLSDILTVLDRLKGLPVGDAAPLASPLALPQALRPDEASPVTNREALQAGAPATDSGFFLVPKVLS